MKSLLIITHIDFWHGGAGHRVRLESLVDYLSRHIKVCVMYLGPLDSAASKYMTGKKNLEILPLGLAGSYHEYGKLAENILLQRSFDAVIIEYIDFAFMLSYITWPALKFLDMHDMLHEKVGKFATHGVPFSGLKLSADDEFGIFECFDVVIAIQQREYDMIRERLGNDHAILVPYVASFPASPVRDKVSAIGFVGSEYVANVDAILHFLKDYWPKIRRQGLQLNIYGKVCAKIPSSVLSEFDDVYLAGYQDDLAGVYDDVDIMINPVRVGAGLKIKNVEALAFGKPLITSSHGATGMEDGAGTCFLVADNAEEFKQSLEKLMDTEFRRGLSDRARQYAANNMSGDPYRKLLELIETREV